MIGFLLSAAVIAAPAVVLERAAERELMVLTIESLAATAGPRQARRIDPEVAAAMRKVPRHLFVPEDMRPLAYRNEPLPIGHEATISQPYIVALMTHLLDVDADDAVLEVGTGSGYQAAVLAELVARVHSIEIVAPLAERAAATLRSLGYANVEVRAGDGYAGWPEQAPFDKIIVTAGADHLPQPLVDQLKAGGRMVIPLGRDPDSLELTVVDKDLEGRIRKRQLLPVRFVPLTRAR